MLNVLRADIHFILSYRPLFIIICMYACKLGEGGILDDDPVTETFLMLMQDNCTTCFE